MTTPSTAAGRALLEAFEVAFRDMGLSGAAVGEFMRRLPLHIADIEAEARQAAPLDDYERGKQDTLERMRAMRLDWQSMPHAEFPKKWPDWKDYREVLPRWCSCRECILWSSGS